MLLEEGKRLYDLGLGVHLLKEKSKAPVKSGWSGPTRDKFEDIKKEYKKGQGLGVRLGEPSKLGNGYLAVIDVDLKSQDPRHRKEAFDTVDNKFPGLRQKAPFVKTGRGFHFYARTKLPIRSGKLGSSHDTVKILSPGSEVNRRQTSLLSKEEIKKGLRVKNAWEVELMSVGKQVVLPPTRHPDTGEPYKWAKPLIDINNLPLIETNDDDTYRKSDRPVDHVVKKFIPVHVDLLTSKLSGHIIDMIMTGNNVDDRSVACFVVAIAMIKAGFSDDEILSILTDRETFLGETAYDTGHRNTDSRDNAADWIREYTLKNAHASVDADKVFKDEVGVTPLIEDKEKVIAQSIELTEAVDWQSKLNRSGPKGDGPPKPTLENTVLVLENAIEKNSFGHDEFSIRDVYFKNTPWGGIKNEILTDLSAIEITYWLGKNFRFEPSKNIIFDALNYVLSKNKFHPVKKELKALPKWDGINRLDTWLKKNFEAKEPAEYLAQVFRKWMVASVTRIFIPGIKFDWMPILQGTQGTGKSSFGSILFGEKYFSDWLPPLHDKDAAIGLQGIRCHEFSELESLNKNEIETTKAFVTRKIDKVRPPFGRLKVEIKRQCVFFGTTNREEYLIDDTGNRRFNPIEVGHLNFKQLVKDRDQLWAEALFIYENKLEDNFYLNGEADKFAIKIRDQKVVKTDANLIADILTEFHQDMTTKKDHPKFDFSCFRMSDLFGSFQAPLSTWSFTKRNEQFAAKALRFLGGIRDTTGKVKTWKIEEWTKKE